MSIRPKLYGVPLSQPFRAIAWTLLQEKIPFDVQLTVPGNNSRMGSLHESYLAKANGRTMGRVPLYEEESLHVTESPAILVYICESRKWNHLYPSTNASSSKSRIDSYLHWHHEGTRQLARLTRSYVRPELKLSSGPSDEVQEQTHGVLKCLEQAWLNDGAFLSGNQNGTSEQHHHSIADLLCYEELVQATLTNVLHIDPKEYPNLSKWMKRMEALPFYTEVHQSLLTLGSLTDATNDTPMMKRLGAATKEGMAAMQKAQEKFSS